MAKKWTLLAYKELSADATTLDTADGVIKGTGSYFSKSRSLHVVMWGASASGGATNAILRLGDETNGIDSGSSYKWVRFRGNTSGAPSKENQSSATTSFYNSIFVAGNSGIDTWHFIEFDIDNTETQVKGVNSRTMRTNDSSLANALETQWTSGEWSKTDRQCQRIQLTGSGGDSEYASGTGIAVYGYIDDTVSDEKTTLTNVPSNTRYEETDTRKIYRRSKSSSLGSPDLEITDASGWSTSGSGLSINSSGVITQTSSMSANARLQKSLGFTLGDTWTIDYEFTRTSSSGNNVRPLVVASSADNINDSGTDNDVLGQYGDTNFNTFKKVGTGAGAALGWIAGDTTKRYMRMSRTSDTNFRLEVYTDSARTTRLNSNCGGYTDAEYNFNGCSAMNSVGNGMIDFPISAGTVTGLDTLISGNGSSANGHSGTIENIKVYNNQVVQSNVSQKYGNPNTNADVNYGTYKQIRNLIPDDIITGVTLGIYNASADFKVAIFTESSNAPNTLLGTTTTKTGVSVSNTYTNYEITLDTPVTVPSDGKVWVCAYPSTTIKYAVRVDAGSDWYNSRYGGTSASYSSAFPSTMWASTGQGTYNPMFGVIIGEGQWKERGTA